MSGLKTKYVETLENRIDELEKESKRLKEGNFTEEEFQNLCHHFDEGDECRFKQGCLDYWKKLFGGNSNLIEVDIPTGYELACGKMRRPRFGEYYISTTLIETVKQYDDENKIIGPRVILKKKAELMNE